MYQFLIALHTLQNHMWRCIPKHTKNIYMQKENVSIIKSHSNVKTEYVWVTLTQFGLQHEHVKSQCINSWLHSINCKIICEDGSPNKQKTLTCKNTMLASWIRIQMSKHNMFESHWGNFPSNTNMSNLNVSIMKSSPYIAKPCVQTWPHFQDKCIQTIKQCLHQEVKCKCQNIICLCHISKINVEPRTWAIAMYQMWNAMLTS